MHELCTRVRAQTVHSFSFNIMIILNNVKTVLCEKRAQTVHNACTNRAYHFCQQTDFINFFEGGFTLPDYT